MKKNSRTKTAASALVIVLVIGLAWGCSESPVGPGISSNGPHLLGRSPEAVSHLLQASTPSIEKHIMAAEGGQLALTDVVLDVPPYAVRTDTTFSILIPDAGVFFCEFGTSGLVFDTPVTVTMLYGDADLRGVDESTIRIAYLNDATGVWEDLQCEVDPVNKVVVAHMNHFSRYGLISD